jgi:hypothetical protein
VALEIVDFILCVTLRSGNVDPFALWRLACILQNILWHADSIDWVLYCMKVKRALTTVTSAN